MKGQLAQVHWGQILSAGILVAILSVLLNVMVFFLAIHIWDTPDQTSIATQVAVWSSSMLSILLTVVFAVQVAHKVEKEAQLHGFLLGLVAALLLLLLSSGFQGEFVLVTLVSTILTIAAGWFGGAFGSRMR